MLHHHPRLSWLSFPIALLAALVLAPAAAAQATFNVDSTADAPLQNSAGTTCLSTADTCTLRAAVQAADNSGASSTINVPAGIYTLKIASSGNSNDPATGDLNLNGDISIKGAGSAETVIDANYVDRAFYVNSGTSSISGVTIENGRPGSTGTTSTCPAISVTAEGGAIYNAGALTLSGDLITGNLSAGSGGGVEDTGSALSVSDSQFTRNTSCLSASTTADHFGYGGAINVDAGGQASIDHSTFSDNAAPGADGGAVAFEGSPFIFILARPRPSASRTSRTQAVGHAQSSAYQVSSSTFSGNTAGFSGGAVFMESPSNTVLLQGDTMTGNTASTATAGTSPGGGLFLENGGTATVVNSTIAENSAPSGGGVGSDGGTVNLEFSTITGNRATAGTGNLDQVGTSTIAVDDSIVAGGIGTGGATQSNCTGTITDHGYNLFDDTSDSGSQCGSSSTTHDVITGSPGVEPLADNGGPTQTEALAPTSPAINAASDALCQSETGDVDQRGVTRPQGAGCDIGAYEYAGADLSLRASAAQSAIDVGQQDTVTDTITNSGPAYATGVTFRDPAPSGFSISAVTTSAGSCIHSDTSVTCSLGTLGIGAQAQVHITLKATSAGVIQLKSSVSSAQPDPTPGDNSATVTINVASAVVSADLGVKVSAPKSVLPGKRVSFKVLATNHGPARATQVVVTDTLPKGVKLITDHKLCRGKRKLTCSGFSLKPGGHKTIRITVQTKKRGYIVDTARVKSAATDPHTGNNTSRVRVLVGSPSRCLSPMVYSTSYDKPVSVRMVTVYVNGHVYRTYHVDYRLIVVDAPFHLRSFHARVVFNLADGARVVLTRTYHGCHAGPTHAQNTPG